MKRVGNLWPSVVSWENLVRAARQAERGKRRRPNVARFNFTREWELIRLQMELEESTYRPGTYRTFWINDYKPRLISAAPYRDRVVHHALCNVIEPIFDRQFIYDTYACRKGKGAHAAVDRFTHYARRHPYVLRCDVRKYFPCIDHQVLLSLIECEIKDRRVLDLIRLILREGPDQPSPVDYFPGDDLFTPLERRRGIPIGNLTSQLFANAYLNGLDHFVKETLRCPGYIRYCDDFACFGDTKAYLWEVKAAMDERLAVLRLRLHPNKCAVQPASVGTPFLGYVVYPDHRRLRRRNGVKFLKRMKALQRRYGRGDVGGAELRASIHAWIGHASHADTYRLRESLLGQVAFSRAQAQGFARRRVEQHA